MHLIQTCAISVASSGLRIAMARRLRPEQREVDHIQPAQNAVDDCPKYRMVGSVGYRDSKGGTKAHAVFRSLDSNAVVTVFHDYLSCRPDNSIPGEQGSF